MSWHVPTPSPVDLAPRYFKRIRGAANGAYRELLSPPKLTRLSLARGVEEKRAMAHHAPGDGWRYLPTRAEYIHNGSY
jgi:hypothetical protein